MSLHQRGLIDLPGHAAGGFDHGDVDWASGRVFVAHTANGTVEIIDGERDTFVATVSGCPEASGILCVQGDGLTFAAARGEGEVLVIDSATGVVKRELESGPKPNGLAWDTRRRRLLAASVEDFQARLIDPDTGATVAATELTGRPRWCVYDRERDRFLINIREPACVDVLSAATLARLAVLPVGAQGPHGLDLDESSQRAFVACDSGVVVGLDLGTGWEIVTVPIAGEPDAIWSNRFRNKLYVAIGKPGVVDVLNTRTMALDERIVTEEGVHTTAFDPIRQKLYVFLPRGCRAAVYAEE